MGDEKDWDFATETLKAAVEELGKSYIINEGDGAFYGPKLDFHLEDSIGRTWQCGTIQLDMQLPERFELEYVGADGEKHRPVMIHRVVFGSIERFIGVITEHFAGAFPTWLAPVQVKIMPITDRTAEYAKAVAEKLEALGIRTETDLRNEKIGYKIREAQLKKIPYAGCWRQGSRGRFCCRPHPLRRGQGRHRHRRVHCQHHRRDQDPRKVN